ncbi:Choline transporter-like protein 1 [Labeo rohita]|uniref:Choline transporter-like protein 1 n=1 Tax=Labeo rohita TaxID=84645 RepID=A0ABQ8N0H4_LABRO|nr:Choline transporter-like protein 1 [Labeo rohita]
MFSSVTEDKEEEEEEEDRTAPPSPCHGIRQGELQHLCICGFAIATGAASRLISGYDSYGNICGQKNAKIPGIELSGLNHTSRKYVFFLDPCNIDILGRKIKSVALCVSKCPDAELKTYEDLTTFSTVNGSQLCSYDVQPDTYSSNPNRETKCPKLPVHPR